MRMNGDFLSAWVEGILQLFTKFYLQRKFSIFLRNDHDCKNQNQGVHVEFSVCRPSPLNTFFYEQEEIWLQQENP